MWKLRKITIENIAAFHKSEYIFHSNVATLVYGENLDNDSQKSNGSGKSALSEAIAFCLTGNPLRNIKNDEIINNDKDFASVTLELINASLNSILKITREIPRKGSQKILVYETINDSEKQIVKSSVDEYNKWILEYIGISKDEIYSSFILCKSRYSDFLLASDKEKKEIINKFSRGNLVDQSINAVQKDKEPVSKKIEDIKNQISYLSGKIDAIKSQIEEEKESKIEKEKEKEERIESLKSKIKQLDSDIKEKTSIIDSLKQLIEKAKDIAGQINDFEENNYNSLDLNGIKAYLDSICTVLDFDYDNYNDTEYIERINHSQEMIVSIVNQKNVIQNELVVLNDDLDKATEEFEYNKKLFDDLTEQYCVFEKNINNQNFQINKDILELEEEIKSSKRKIAELESKCMSSIECPHCHNRFVVSDPDFDIKKAEVRIKELKSNLLTFTSSIKTLEETLSSNLSSLKDEKAKLKTQEQIYSQYVSKQMMIKDEILKRNKQIQRLDNQEKDEELYIKNNQEKLNLLIDDMISDLFDELSSLVRKTKNEIKITENLISTLEGAISSSRKSIEDLKSYSLDQYVDNLIKGQNEASEKMKEVESEYNLHIEKLNVLNEQEIRFNSFKTYLANSKIDSLSAITNEFLEQIGSDLKVRFEGYTLLKSGKLKDKISIAILRDGIDIGSIGKLSVGEMSRIQLATILAMNKLINLNADNDKGLDLLLIDEVLDGVDESGLDNIIKSINKIGITSIIISHGKTVESYPYRLVIKKQNGISTIHG